MGPHDDWYHVLTTPGNMLRSLAFSRTYLWIAIIFAAFAVWVPLRLGVAFLDAVVLGAYASLAVVFAAPLAAASGHVLRPVLAGIALSWAMLATGVVLVYLTRNVVVGPNLRSLAECGLFGATLAAAVASCVGYVRKVASENAARVAARVILLALLALFYLRSRWLPDVALQGAALLEGLWLLFTWLPLRSRVK
jgi:ABC-type enterochelin transport system permease subunit